MEMTKPAASGFQSQKEKWRVLLRERRWTLIFAVALVCLLLLALLLLRPTAVRAGTLSVRVNGTVTEIPGTETFRVFNGRADTGADVSADQLAAAPHIVGGDGVELLLDGALFNGKAYVSVYDAEQNPISLEQEQLLVPAEAGTYLVRVEAFWGEKANLAASTYCFWLDVAAL